MLFLFNVQPRNKYDDDDDHGVTRRKDAGSDLDT